MPRLKFASPEEKQKWKEEKKKYNKEYKQTSKYRNYLKEKRKRPDQKEYNKNYLKREDVKERYKPKRAKYFKERKKDPEVAKKLKEYNAEWAKRPDVKERRNKAKRDRRKKVKVQSYYKQKYDAKRALEVMHQHQVDRVIQKLKLNEYIKQHRIKQQKIQLAIDINFVLNRQKIYRHVIRKIKAHWANGEINRVCWTTTSMGSNSYSNKIMGEMAETSGKCG